MWDLQNFLEEILGGGGAACRRVVLLNRSDVDSPFLPTFCIVAWSKFKKRFEKFS